MLCRLFISVVFTSFSIFLYGCQSAHRENLNVTFEAHDLKADRLIIVKLTNSSAKNICLSVSDWPDGDGWVSNLSNRVVLQVEGRQFPLQKGKITDCFDFYDQGVCRYTINPGTSISAEIPYSNFNFPEALNDSYKEVIYEPNYYSCL